MLRELKGAPAQLAAGAALLGLLAVPAAGRAQAPELHSDSAAPVEAGFRGCDAAGWCRFAIEPTARSAPSLHRVRPDGVVRTRGDDALAVAVRDRLNALLADMIHQHKRILLHDLRELDDGTFAAVVTVNGANVASDPVLQELRGMPARTVR